MFTVIAAALGILIGYLVILLTEFIRKPKKIANTGPDITKLIHSDLGKTIQLVMDSNAELKGEIHRLQQVSENIRAALDKSAGTLYRLKANFFLHPRKRRGRMMIECNSQEFIRQLYNMQIEVNKNAKTIPASSIADNAQVQPGNRGH
jgi:hypothetical protein